MFDRTKHNHKTLHDELNYHFQNVVIGPRHKSAYCSSVICQWRFIRIFVDLVQTPLQSLDLKKSTGPDGLSARFLREVAAEIATPLTHLYNASLSSGKFPYDWKRSHITPVHKGGNMEDLCNFRPITVVPVLAKVLEKIVSIQVGSYLEQNSLLDPQQGAYRSGRSTEGILLSAVDFIVHSLDAGNSLCAVFLDF